MITLWLNRRLDFGVRHVLALLMYWFLEFSSRLKVAKGLVSQDHDGYLDRKARFFKLDHCLRISRILVLKPDSTFILSILTSYERGVERHVGDDS